MTPWQRLLERPNARGHFVQLYETDVTALAENVGRYLWEGLLRGDGALVIAAPEHRELFCQRLEQLGADLAALLESRQLIVLDAQQTLAEFMTAGQPDWHSFERTVGRAMRELQPANRDSGRRAYGEMVGILWKAKQFAVAIRLEQFWNRLLEHSSFSLYCAYAIDVFGKEFQIANLDGVLGTHTHLVPTQPDGSLERALDLAMDDVLGEQAGALRVRIKEHHRPSWAIMPDAEALVLWLRNHLPEQADNIVDRARYHFHARGSAEPLLVNSSRQ